ncbi:MAG TPA: hypothetical protein VEY08_05995 [Chloroflexia bacterium]|nr:hypothetical protein [Chloroflexia bacterium]
MFGRRLSLAIAALLLALLPVLSAGAANRYAPLAASMEGWSAPVNISNSKQYDNTPSIAASPNGAVSIIWLRSQGANPNANLLLQARNSALGGGFQQEQLAESVPQKSSGGAIVRRDALGRKHIIWWQYEGRAVCDYYLRIEADGRTSIKEQVPGTCGHSYKNTALAIGPDNNAHMLFGQNLQSLFYWVRADAGWPVQAERIGGTTTPEAPTLGVTTQGTAIAAWKDKAPGGFGDVYTGVRQAPGKWQVENVSHTLTPGCEGNSITDEPALAADPAGGMRLVWEDERCDPRNPEPTLREPYYREWVPATGWNALPPVRVHRTPGNAFGIAITVDAGGTAHVVWATVLRERFTLYYASGRGNRFSDPATPFDGWARDEAIKDMSLAYSPGYLHMAFGSPRDDPDKENYYKYLQIGDPPPPPTPTPPPLPKLPPSNEKVPGNGSRAFPETGYTVTGVFLDYWNAHGGLRQQGFPISNVVRETSPLDGKPYLMQYFERAVFEYHPENPAGSNVLLSQLGTFQYRRKYPSGAPNQRPNQDAVAPFPETGHRVGGSFLQYWQQNGGLAQQGFPISDEFTEVSETDGKTYTVQYFERAVFEWHPANPPPNNVLLSLLGVFRLKQQYGGG